MATKFVLGITTEEDLWKRVKYWIVVGSRDADVEIWSCQGPKEQIGQKIGPFPKAKLECGGWPAELNILISVAYYME